MAVNRVVGLIWSGFPQPWQQALLDRLAGRYVVEPRYARGAGTACLEAYVKEFVADRHVDLVVAGDTPAAQAAKRATSTIPIVVAASADCVATGLVTNLARPEGNITGLTSHSADDERFLILVDFLLANGREPSPVAVLWNADNPAKRIEAERTLAMAHSCDPPVEARSLCVAAPGYDFRGAFDQGHGAAAVVVLEDPITVEHRQHVVDLTTTHKLPAIFESRPFVDAGGLMCYGADRYRAYARAADYVEMILEWGLEPGELPPVQQLDPELIISRTAAIGLGLEVFPKQLRGCTPVIV